MLSEMREKLRRKLPEGSEGLFIFLHLVVIAFGASHDDFVVPGIAIASLLIGSILGRDPKRDGLTRQQRVVLQGRLSARERRLKRMQSCDGERRAQLGGIDPE